MSTLTTIHEDERVILARVRNVAFVGWRAEPQATHIREWHRLGKSIAREHPGAGACVDVVMGGTPRFPDDVRKASEELARDSKSFERGIAHVILMPGLAGTAVRTFIQTVLLVSRTAVPAKVVGDTRSASVWLGPRIADTGWSDRALLTSIEELARALV